MEGTGRVALIREGASRAEGGTLPQQSSTCSSATASVDVHLASASRRQMETISGRVATIQRSRRQFAGQEHEGEGGTTGFSWRCRLGMMPSRLTRPISSYWPPSFHPSLQ